MGEGVDQQFTDQHEQDGVEGDEEGDEVDAMATGAARRMGNEREIIGGVATHPDRQLHAQRARQVTQRD